jgi:hypothetical protein
MTFDEVQAYVVAGRAVLTLESKRTGNHYTYKVSQARSKLTGLPTPNTYFVNLLTGPDNLSDYTYLGMMTAEGKALRFRTTAASRLKQGTPSVAGWNYLLAHLGYGRLPSDMVVRHEGRCGKCARVLTHPESLQRGIGPECWVRVGGGLLCTTEGE